MGKGMGAVALSVLGFALWLAMCVYMLKHPTWREGHLITIAVGLTLQILVLPTHPYNFIFVVPLLLLGAKHIWSALIKPDWKFAILVTLFALCVYLAYYLWFTILIGDSSGAVSATSMLGILLALKRALPGNVYMLPVGAMVLGMRVLGIARMESGLKT